jgi:hypothetical protein
MQPDGRSEAQRSGPAERNKASLTRRGLDNRVGRQEGVSDMWVNHSRAGVDASHWGRLRQVPTPLR